MDTSAPTKRPDVLSQTVQITTGPESPMSGYLARPARPGRFPGVLVGMELFGISGHVRDVCDRLAGLGYVVLAPDLYHRGAPGIEIPENAEGRERGFALLHDLTREQALADVAAGLDYLHAAGCARVGMVGLSVGGHVAYLAASVLDLPAVVVAYGGWIPTTDIPLSQPEPTLAATAGITGRVLFLVGDNDQLIAAQDARAIADALRNAGIRHDLVRYPGVRHGFLSDRRDSYDSAAAEDAWQRISELLAAELR